MGRKDRGRRTAYRAAVIFLAVCAACLLAGTVNQRRKEGIGKQALGQMEEAMISFWCPALSFAAGPSEGGILGRLFGQFPVLQFFCKQSEPGLLQESPWTYEEIVRAEGQDDDTGNLPEEKLDAPETSGGRVEVDETMQDLLDLENGRTGPKQESREEGQEGKKEGTGAGQTEKQEEYRWEFYETYDALLEEFYAVDATTAADETLLNLDALLGKDLSVEKRDDDAPQILIYHTHSQEGFVDSVPGDNSTTIVGVGEYLTQILRDTYGYNVIHNTNVYDFIDGELDRNQAYTLAEADVQQILAENPTIEVIIDLHRDGVQEDTHLVTEVNGKPTAQIMFFNGLSFSKRNGPIDYLQNPYIGENLSLSLQLKLACEKYYPGFTRKVYLKSLRYNLHLRPKSLLVEAGAQTNTLQEMLNAMEPLAYVLNQVLKNP